MSFTFSWVSTPGQNNNFVNGSINSGRARAFLDDGNVDPFDSPLYICIPPITFLGGDAGAANIYDFAKLLRTCTLTTVENPGIDYRGHTIKTGGALTLNDIPFGNYEFNVLPTTLLDQATVATLFSNTNDKSTFIVVKGNLTIGANVTLVPTVNPSYTKPINPTQPDPDAKRRLFMVVYVTGNLTFANNSSLISMTACGGNSSAQGADIGFDPVPVASNVYYYNGSSSSQISPQIQYLGGSGGAGVTNGSGNSGSAGTIGGDGSTISTGGGGSGNQVGGADIYSGGGGNGSAFSGGAGGGSSRELEGATAGSGFGAKGGDGAPAGEDGGTVGGTGNPGGDGSSSSGNTGTGGVLIVICEGNLGTTGRLRANGVDGASNGGDQGGGASGGGIVVVIQPSSTGNIPTTTVDGGNASPGGSGGAGNSVKYGINS
jgi:hypothetical protein